MGYQLESIFKYDLFLRATTLESMPEHAHQHAEMQTLGSVRLQNVETKEIVLVPKPSDDHNDPLTWSKPFRYYLALIVCLIVTLSNFLAAGPSVAIADTAIDFFGTVSDASISKTAYFFTTTSLTQGLGNMFWMPLAIKYGRRPVYIASLVIYTITAIWVPTATTYENALLARMVMGFAAGAAECIGTLTISDVFFLHERGSIMALYTASLNFGVSLGIIFSGLITMGLSWRDVYWIVAALVGCLTLIVFLTMPETSYIRRYTESQATVKAPGNKVNNSLTRRSYLQSLRLCQGQFTSEGLLKLFIRPVVMFVLPPVMLATLVMSVTIGFAVAISSNFADAYSDNYNFDAWESGLMFSSAIVGSALGIVFGGLVSDRVASWLTVRNGGVREPEFRLPATLIGILTTPLALCLYGVGMQHHWHWMIPTVGLGLLNFSIAQATNVSLVYTVDAYRAVAGEAVVAQLGFKSAFGFLLSFHTNPWISKAGYQNAFGTMAAISVVVLAGWVPLFMFGIAMSENSIADILAMITSG